MKRLEGKVAVVTGGADGIGRAIALRMAEAGAKVAVTDVQSAQAVVDEIGAMGGLAKAWHVDVTDEASVAESLIEIAEYFGGIDVLVNNAGVAGVNKPTHEITEAEWDRVMAVNVKGVFFCTKHVVPLMQARSGGCIVNMASIYGLAGAGDLPPYHASKGAVHAMTKNDALLYAKDRIRVNAVYPGFIWTPLVEVLAQAAPQGPAAYRAGLEARHPLGTVGAPDDVAWGVVYLASDEARFLTGSELRIDGGYLAQ